MSSSRQKLWYPKAPSADTLRRFMNFWPPLLFAGIRILAISDDFMRVDVRLRLGRFNRNYVGTQYGGSLYSMTDPFFMVMMVHVLGPDYVVWDKSGRIDYLRPGREDVFARLQYTGDQIAEVRRMTAGGQKFEPTYAVDVATASGEVIARVEKTLYIRLKAPAPEPGV